MGGGGGDSVHQIPAGAKQYSTLRGEKVLLEHCIGKKKLGAEKKFRGVGKKI